MVFQERQFGSRLGGRYPTYYYYYSSSSYYYYCVIPKTYREGRTPFLANRFPKFPSSQIHRRLQLSVSQQSNMLYVDAPQSKQQTLADT